MEDDGILLTEGRDDWINWLVNNHHGDKGIWLHIRKKKAPPPGVYYEDALEEALCFGWIDGKMKSLNPQGFMVRFTPRRPGSLWSARNREKAEKLIAAGRMEPAGMQAVEEARKNGKWEEAYDMMTDPAIPDDLHLALKENPAALKNFMGFARGYRNRYIFHITMAKTPGTRTKRIRMVIDRAARNIKPGF